MHRVASRILAQRAVAAQPQVEEPDMLSQRRSTFQPFIPGPTKRRECARGFSASPQL